MWLWIRMVYWSKVSMRRAAAAGKKSFCNQEHCCFQTQLRSLGNWQLPRDLSETNRFISCCISVHCCKWAKRAYEHLHSWLEKISGLPYGAETEKLSMGQHGKKGIVHSSKHSWRGSRELHVVGLSGPLFWILVIMNAHICQSEMLICGGIVFLN